MKLTFRIILFVALLIANAKTYGQFKLSGKISNYTGKEEVKINIPLVYGFNKENSITIPVDNSGNFKIELPLKEIKFGDFIFQKTFYTFLLKPGKTLSLQCNEIDSTVIPISGTAVEENQFMSQINLREQPFFMLAGKSFNDSLTSIAAIEDKVVKPWNKIRDKRIKEIRNSKLLEQDKSLIIAEIKYNAINHLSYLRYNLTDKKLANAFYLYLYDSLSAVPEVFPAGPEYYSFARSYLGYLGPKAIDNKNKKGLSNKEPLDFYKISYDSVMVLETKFGAPYLRWISSNNILPLPVIENLTYQEINGIYTTKDLRILAPLVEVYRSRFPAGRYSLAAQNKVNQLRQELAVNNKNKKIEIYPNYEKTNSIYEVLKSLRGKVVYLDVWGTWCGPCKEELKYTSALKAHFKNKDVAYVYLDLDDDLLDAKWKEFIKVNNIEGLHLRKSRQTIIPFWKELLANTNDKDEYYPQYFIFDKTGKLVVAKAKRPSQKEELYTQIEEFLK